MENTVLLSIDIKEEGLEVKLKEEAYGNLALEQKMINLSRLTKNIMHNMKSLRGKKVLITIPELKKSNISLSGADEEKIMADAMKKWQKLEVFATGTEVTDVNKGDMVYVQSYSLETGEKIEVDGKMRILIPENAIAIIWQI